MSEFKRVKDIEEVIVELMNLGISRNKIELQDEYHADGNSEVIIQDIVLIVKSNNNSIWFDELLETREIKDTSPESDKKADEKIKELEEIINEFMS